MMVAACHSLMIFRLSGVQADVAGRLGVFCNGRAAVTLFFVLSGFVLGLALRRAEPGIVSGLWRFSVRRIFRIYPAFLCSTAFILAWLFFGARLFPSVSHWLDQATFGYHAGMLNSQAPPSGSLILNNLFLLDSSMNLVTWTLKVQ